MSLGYTDLTIYNSLQQGKEKKQQNTTEKSLWGTNENKIKIWSVFFKEKQYVIFIPWLTRKLFLFA